MDPEIVTSSKFAWAMMRRINPAKIERNTILKIFVRSALLAPRRVSLLDNTKMRKKENIGSIMGVRIIVSLLGYYASKAKTGFAPA